MVSSFQALCPSMMLSLSGCSGAQREGAESCNSSPFPDPGAVRVISAPGSAPSPEQPKLNHCSVHSSGVGSLATAERHKG